MCKSVLLESALKNILKNHVTTYNECNVILADQSLEIDKPYLLISSKENSDIKKPFTRSSLMLHLEKFSKSNISYKDLSLPKELENEIDKVVNNFSQQIAQIIKSHHENK